jgi:hypothetical protein
MRKVIKKMWKIRCLDMLKAPLLLPSGVPCKGTSVAQKEDEVKKSTNGHLLTPN